MLIASLTRSAKILCRWSWTRAAFSSTRAPRGNELWLTALLSTQHSRESSMSMKNVGIMCSRISMSLQGKNSVSLSRSCRVLLTRFVKTSVCIVNALEMFNNAIVDSWKTKVLRCGLAKPALERCNPAVLQFVVAGRLHGNKLLNHMLRHAMRSESATCSWRRDWVHNLHWISLVGFPCPTREHIVCCAPHGRLFGQTKQPA